MFSRGYEQNCAYCNSLKFSSTGYKPIGNKLKLVKPQKELMKLHLEQDDLIKAGLNIQQNVENIKLKINKLTSKVLERPI